MNIAIATEYFGETTGGVETRLLNIAKRIKPPYYATIFTSRQEKNKDQGLKVKRIGPVHQYSNKGSIFTRLLFAMSLFLELWYQDPYDLYVAYSFLTYLPVSLVAMIKRRPSIAVYHECWIGQWIKLKGFLTGLFGEVWETLSVTLGFTRIIAVSQTTKNSIPYEKKLISVIYNGVELHPHKEKKMYDICVVSRLIESKKVHELIEAVKTLPKKKVIIVGQGEELVNLKKQAKWHNLNNITFAGFVKDPIKIMQQSKVLVHPSISEGFGIVPLEAISCGTPVIYRDIPVLKEVIGKQGYAFTTIEELATLLKKKHLKKPRLNKKFLWNNIAEQELNIYKKTAYARKN